VLAPAPDLAVRASDAVGAALRERDVDRVGEGAPEDLARCAPARHGARAIARAALVERLRDLRDALPDDLRLRRQDAWRLRVLLERVAPVERAHVAVAKEHVIRLTHAHLDVVL